MKLAIVRQKYTPFGGAERFVDQAIGALRAQGVDVSIVARQWTGDVQGITLDPFYLGRTWRDMSFGRAVQRLIAARQFDLVQSHERIPGCHIYRAGDGVHATWLEIRNKPLDALSPWHRYILRAEEAMFRHPNLRAVICNSRMVRDDIARRFGVADEKLHVIYNGVDLARFNPARRHGDGDQFRRSIGIAPATPVILFVGSGFQRKGLTELLHALRRMHNTGAVLWVIGRDKQEPQMLTLAQELGISSRVRFYGAQRDVSLYYSAADIFALPTHYDPLPNAALEALASGLPVLTTENCGAAELLSSGSGVYVRPDDIDSMANSLDRLCDSAGTMRDSSRATVQGLDMRTMAESLSTLYSSLV